MSSAAARLEVENGDAADDLRGLADSIQDTAAKIYQFRDDIDD
jgi:hypothetical protein